MVPTKKPTRRISASMPFWPMRFTIWLAEERIKYIRTIQAKEAMATIAMVARSSLPFLVAVILNTVASTPGPNIIGKASGIKAGSVLRMV